MAAVGCSWLAPQRATHEDENGRDEKEAERAANHNASDGAAGEVVPTSSADV